jgi:Na+/H+ antiporter NhaD/arsenite permease-like protein
MAAFPRLRFGLVQFLSAFSKLGRRVSSASHTARFLLALLACFLLPPFVQAAAGLPLDVPIWSTAPFILLLACIAILPLAAEHFWHNNRNKAIVVAVFALPAVGYSLARHAATDGRSTEALVAEIDEYLAFVLLLGSLYVVSGGIVLKGTIRARPLTNTGLLAAGAVLANAIGTTGASMLLIRPLLRINSDRRSKRHVPVFFILSVSNVGGLLTPLGDPPLFLGFLHGVPFGWTLRLWPQYLLVNGAVLAIFWSWDALAFRSERPDATPAEIPEPVRISGAINFLFLAGILAAVLLQSPQLGLPFVLHKPWGEIAMAAMIGLSLAWTSRDLRRANGFTWGPIVEVAVIFAGIFVTMVPALHLLRGRGPALGLNQLLPWQYYVLTGGLSAFLDNAPTYLAFATMAASPDDLAWLAANRPLVLEAISCGSVFMGAMTYVGNGPNFMVKAIADEAGYQMPSFFGYLLVSLLVLGPVLLLTALLFF